MEWRNTAPSTSPTTTTFHFFISARAFCLFWIMGFEPYFGDYDSIFVVGNGTTVVQRP